MEKYPDCLRDSWPTPSDFRQAKRKEMDTVIRAWEEFRCGCAYVPGYCEYQDRINAAIVAWRERMTVKAWGR